MHLDHTFKHDAGPGNGKDTVLVFGKRYLFIADLKHRRLLFPIIARLLLRGKLNHATPSDFQPPSARGREAAAPHLWDPPWNRQRKALGLLPPFSGGPLVPGGAPFERDTEIIDPVIEDELYEIDPGPPHDFGTPD